MIRQTAFVLTAVLLFLPSLSAQVRTLLSTDPVAYGVSYVEVLPASRAMAVTALKQYSEASRKDDGYLSVGVYEQIGHPGHFLILEKWAEQKSFDTHGMAESTNQLMTKLDPVRIALDQRAYKTFTAADAPKTNDRAITVVSHVDTAGNQVDAPTVLRQLAEMSRKEKGNVRFDVLQNARQPNHFTVVETWQSQEMRDAHVIAAHTREFRKSIQPVLGSPLDERLFKLVG